MKRLILSLVAASMVLIVFGCSNTQDPVEESTPLFTEMRIRPSITLFTETLGDIGIPIAEGSGIVAAGVGLVCLIGPSRARPPSSQRAVAWIRLMASRYLSRKPRRPDGQ